VAIKSLVITVEIDHALKGHDCQANAKHRILKGDLRLKVKDGRSPDHYCMLCASVMIQRGIDKLLDLQQRLPPAQVCPLASGRLHHTQTKAVQPFPTPLRD
jgi:hypothetical protein